MPRRRRCAEPGLLRRQRLGGEQRQDHVLDAEPGIDRLQLRRQQAGEMAGVAARPGGADADMLDPAVDPVKGEVEAAGARSLARQPRRQILRQPLDRADEIGRVGDRLGKAEAHPPHRRLAQRRQRLRQIAERLIEATPHGFAEAAGKRVARHRVKLADPPEPDPAQPGHGRRIEPQGLDRQRRQRLPARRSGVGSAGRPSCRREAGQGPGGAERAGDRDAAGDVLGASGAAPDRRQAPPRRPTNGRSR